MTQDHDAVGHLGHHRQIVGDVDRRRLKLVDDVADGGEHLDLGGDVEGGGRLVEDDEVGTAGHGHGGHGALQLATRHLVGIAAADHVGIRQLEPAVEIDGVLLGLVAPFETVGEHGLDRLLDDAVGGVEGGGGALGDIGDARAPELAAAAVIGGEEIDAVEHHRAAADAAAGLGIAHGGKPDGRLAGPRFTDQTQHLAALQRDVDAAHDLVPFVVAEALDAQVLDLKQRGAFFPRRGGGSNAHP